MLQNIYLESFLILKPLMTTPLSWIGGSLLRYGASTECIGFDWSNHQITIVNNRVESGSTVAYNEIVLGTIPDGSGIEIIGANKTSATICAESEGASITLSAVTNCKFDVNVGKTSGGFSFDFPTGSSIHKPLEASISNDGSWIVLCRANQKDDENNSVYFEFGDYGIHMPLLWKTSATDSIKVRNIDYPINFYDAEFLSLTDNSDVADTGSRNNMLAQTIPSTYAVRNGIADAIAAAVPAPFSFVAMTDDNNNDFFGIKFTDPANSNTTKTLWFNFATIDGENVGIGEWENATTRKSTTP